MPTYSIAEAKARLSQLIDQALAGEEVTITRNGKPVAELRAAAPAERGRPSAHLIDRLTRRAKRLPALGEPAADLVRRMRDEREVILASGPSAAPMFARYIGVDYSGAETPTSQLPGIQVYVAVGAAPPAEVRPPQPARRWSRRALAEWLIGELSAGPRTLVGIDHAFSFPLRYFDKYRLSRDWSSFLDDFQRHWPTDADSLYVDFVRDGVVGDGAARQGHSKWRRLTDERTRGAKSVFHFDVPGSVAKSTHARLPWLRTIRRRLGAQVHFWPFDGWSVAEGRSAIVEAYPALHNRLYPAEGRTPHQHDAFSVAAWMANADRSGQLEWFFNPALAEREREVAEVEGWIFGA